MTGRKNDVDFPCMALLRRDVANTTVFVLHDLPVHERSAPVACSLQRYKAFDRKLRAVFGRAKQRLCIGVVFTDPRTRVRRLHTQPVEHVKHSDYRITASSLAACLGITADRSTVSTTVASACVTHPLMRMGERVSLDMVWTIFIVHTMHDFSYCLKMVSLHAYPSWSK